MQLSPSQVIPVSYSTTIPGDTTLYFVQAVLRDTQSSTILQTLNLSRVSSTPNRYTGSFSPVSDPSGLGRPVDVTISVYTDSGHTTLSQNYQITQYNYVVLQPWIQNLGVGGGMNIDYEKLQKMFDGAKVSNAEIGNETAKKAKTKIDYDKITRAISASGESHRTALSGELKGHISTLSSLLEKASSALAQMDTKHSNKFNGIEQRLNTLESKLTDGQKMSTAEKTTMRQELSKLITDTKTALSGSNDRNTRSLVSSFKESIEDVKNHLKEDLLGKEIHLSYNSGEPAKKEKKEKQMFAPDDIMSLLQS